MSRKTTTTNEQGISAISDYDRTAFAATQTLGLAAISVTFGAAVIMIVAWFDGEDVAMFGVLALLVIGATYITWRFDRQWARTVGLFGSIIGLGGFFFAFGLFQVFSPIEFILGVTYVMGVVLSAVGGISALVASRKGKTGTSEGTARVRAVVIGAVGVAAIISIAGFFATKTSVSQADAAGAVTVDMVNFEFEPHASAGPAEGKLLLQTSDPYVHDFTFDELGIKVSVGPGSEAVVDLSGLEPVHTATSAHSTLTGRPT